MSFRKFVLCLIAVISACDAEAPAPAPSAAPARDVSEAARLLSLGGQMASKSGTGYELAVNCAVALGVTSDGLAAIATRANQREIAQVKQAATYFADRAVAGAEGRSERQVRATIARDRQVKANEKAEQAQLAIVCLRSLPERF